MRKSILLAIGLIITAVPTVGAVELKDCSQGSTEKRLVCFQENIKLLNMQADELKKQIPKLDEIVIQWFGHDNSCLIYLGNNLVQVRDVCTDPNQNRFVIRPYHP